MFLEGHVIIFLISHLRFEPPGLSETATSFVFLLLSESSNSILPVTSPPLFNIVNLGPRSIVFSLSQMGDGSLSRTGGNVDASNVLDIYPLNHYYFGSKEALPFKEEETLDHRIQRLKFKYIFSPFLLFFYLSIYHMLLQLNSVS